MHQSNWTLCCEKLQLDPAVIAAPMMTTMVDCSGILTYLIISGFVIGHPTEEHLEAMEAHLEREIEEQFGVAPCADLGPSRERLGCGRHRLLGCEQILERINLTVR